MPQILVSGEALIDLTASSHQNNAYVPVPGGSPFNVATGLGNLNIPVHFLGSISNDFHGQLQRQCLEQAKVSLRFVQDCNRPSALAFAIMPLDGSQEVDYQFYLEGTSESLLDSQAIPKKFPESIQILHFGSFSAYREPQSLIFEQIRLQHAERLISFDPNIRSAMLPNHLQTVEQTEKILRQSDLVKVSLSDLEWLYPKSDAGQIARLWQESFGVQLLVITKGEQGACAFYKNQVIHVPAEPLQNVVDTIGAGDSFMSAFLASLVRHQITDKNVLKQLNLEQIQKMLEYAQKAARWTCQQQGALMPSAFHLL